MFEFVLGLSLSNAFVPFAGTIGGLYLVVFINGMHIAFIHTGMINAIRVLLLTSCSALLMENLINA